MIGGDVVADVLAAAGVRVAFGVASGIGVTPKRASSSQKPRTD